MRAATLGTWMALALAGCAGDISLEAGLECGKGTHEEDGLCVPDDSDAVTDSDAVDTDAADAPPIDTDAEEDPDPDPADSDPADSDPDTDSLPEPDADMDGVTASEDCDDGDAGLGAVDEDGDCDGVLMTEDCDDNDPNVGAATTWWIDGDGDGHGVPDSSTTACDQPMGYAATSDDCDDTDGTIWTGCFTGTCTGGGPGLDVYTDPMSYSPEVHVVAVYEPHPGSAIRVENNRSGDVILVLNAYEPVEWIVENPAGANILSIAVTGYNAATSTVTGAGAAGVPVYTDYWSACSYQWPSDTGGCDTPGLMSAAASHYGTPPQSWRGCYGGDSFVVD